MTTVNRDKTRARLPELSTKDLHWLVKNARRELRGRHLEAVALKERLAGAFTGMANVMAGVTWALACRDSLRRSKGHVPTYGKRPASGEMWLPREVLTALRAEIKDRRWSPLGAESWDRVRDWLTVEAQRHIGDAARAKAEAGGMTAVQFYVRMAGETRGTHIDLGSEDRYQ